MLVLYETAAGYALFKVTNDSTLKNPDEIHKNFESSESANKLLKLKAFSKFENTTDALSAVTALVEGKVSQNLKAFLGDNEKILKSETLMISDTKLASSINKKLGINVISDQSVNEIFRGIRSQLSNLITGLAESDMNAMRLGLSHSLSRYKLKFSPDKVDTMIIQAIALLDELDKELNTYSMRVKEWYGWHFPEIVKIIIDNIAFAKTIKEMGFRTNASTCDLSSILPEDIEAAVKEAAEVSMGTEISDEDIENIRYLCDQIISITEYRAQLFDYLKNRMAAIAPNLTSLVGELVGARLISHAGSLMNLSKQPASTIQILGAEKALFRALKAKHDTPKYGLLYHASLVGQAGPKIKGKIARTVATKAAIAIRCDALGDTEGGDIGIELRGKVEARLRQLEGKSVKSMNASASKSKKQQQKAEQISTPSYNQAADAVLETEIVKKRKAEDDVDLVDSSKKLKKGKKEKKEKKEHVEETLSSIPDAPKKSKKEKKMKKSKSD